MVLPAARSHAAVNANLACFPWSCIGIALAHVEPFASRLALDMRPAALQNRRKFAALGLFPLASAFSLAPVVVRTRALSRVLEVLLS